MPQLCHSIDLSEEAGVRYLHFGSEWVQGAMRIARPWSLELDYTRDMMAGLLLRPLKRWPRRVLLIGLGAGSLARYLYHHFPDCHITVVEIDPRVEYVARQHFKLPDDPRRLEVIIGCGADYLLAGGKSFDLIFSDGFDADGRPGVLDTDPFYAAARSRLNDGGFFVVNLLREKGYTRSIRRIGAAFDEHGCVLPPCLSGNTIVLAHAGEAVDLTLQTLQERAAALRAATRLNLLPLVERMQAFDLLPEGSLRF